MIPEELLKKIPLKRIKPMDGMAVTAEIWEEAHDYHRLMHQFHNMLSHGAGILTGLNVIASDPPDRSVYVLPGVALDPWGRPIILSEPLSFDVGYTVEGLLYLLLTYGEGQPTRSSNGQDTSAPRYVHTQFSLEARPDWPESPSVELARLRRQGRDTPLFNAQDTEHPGPNELDLRFRREIGLVTHVAHSLAVTYLGGGSSTDTRHGTGANYMARAFTRLGQDKLYVDHNVPLTAGLEANSLIYLVGRGPFQVSQDEITKLYAYLQAGGTIFMESNRRNIGGGGDPPADNAFFTLLSSLGVALTEVRTGEKLMTDPFLFGAPPPGYETLGAPRLLVADGVIFSSFDYGAMWQGESRDGAAPREEIRAALEFGANIVTYALDRRRQAQQQ
jgi:hypothetical protein